MKRINFWALCVAGTLTLTAVPAFADDEDVKKPAANQSDELFKRLDKNGDGRLIPDEIPDEQGRFFDRLVRLGDRDDNGELTKAEFDAALQRSDAPVQGGEAGRRPGAFGGRPMLDPKQMIERLDKNKDGKLTKDEIPDEGPARFLSQLMERLNKDALTAEDLERARQQFAGGAPGRPGEQGEFFKRLDRNGDGKLQKNELPEPLQERFARAFERAGKDELTAEEFGRAAGQLRGFPGAPGVGRPGGNPEEQFKRMDANSDGKVTLEELPEGFRDRMRPLFERAKKDALTLDDVQNLFAQNREGGPRPEGNRRPYGARPNAERPDGERQPEARDGDRRPEPREGDRRPDGERRPEAREGERRPDGERRPEARDGDRRPEPREGDRRPDGERRPEGAPRDGERRPEGAPRDGEGARPRMPRFFELLDRNRDGRISREELDRLREVFRELDRNEDGQLDPPEIFGAPMQPPFGRGPNAAPFRDGERRPEGAPPRDGDRRPEGGPRDGDRRPEGAPRDDDRRPDAAPREGDRRPEAAPREGDRRPVAGRPAPHPDRERDEPDRPRESDKPREKDEGEK